MAASKAKAEELQSNQAKRTTAKEWKQRSIGDNLELPSGVVVQVKRLGPQAILTEGFVPDSLAPIINEAIRNGRGLPPEKQAEMESDPKKIVEMLTMMDRVLVKAVSDPVVSHLPACESKKTGEKCGADALDDIHQDSKTEGWHVYIEGERDEDVVYVDDVDFQDKTFIFQYVMGGSKDLERFREEQARDVAAVSNGKNLEHAS